MTFAEYMERGIDSIEDYFGAKEALQKECTIADCDLSGVAGIGSFTNPAERTSGSLGPAAYIQPPTLTATVAALMASKKRA